jgi:hypothetical protein
MAVSGREIDLSELKVALDKHHALLEEHCKWAERSVLEDDIRRDIEKLSATYQLLKWWEEFRKIFEPHMKLIAFCLEDVKRAKMKGRPLAPMDIATLDRALGQYQNLVGELTAYLEVVRTERARHASPNKDQREHSDVESGLDKLIQWTEEIETDWNDRCQKIRGGLDRGDVGMTADALSDFGTQVEVSFFTINARVKALAEGIGETAGSLQREAHKVARESRGEQE